MNMITGRRIGMVLTALALVTTVLTAGSVTPATAVVTDTFAGTIDAGGTKWRQHDLAVGTTGFRTLTLDWDVATADLSLGLRNPAGAWVKWAATTARPEVLTYTFDTTGTWVIGVSAKSGGLTSYTVTVDDSAPPVCDADFCGTVDATGANWKQHTFVVTAEGTISATLDWDDPAADLNLGLKSPLGTWVRWATSTTAKPESLVYPATTLGTWTLGAKAMTGRASYDLDVTHSGGTPPPPPDTAQYVSAFGFGPRDEGHAGLYAYGMDWEASSDTILVGDIWNHRVVRFTRDGDRVPGFEITTAGPNGIEPFDVESGPDGSVWVANEAYTRIDHFTHDGTWIRSIGVAGSPGSIYARGCGNGQQHWPTNIAVHPTNGRLYISDGFCRDISMFDAATGQYLSSFGLDPATFGVPKLTPRGIDVDADGNIVLVEHQSNRLAEFTPDGDLVWISAPQTAMLDPRGLAVDPSSGQLYVVSAFWNDVFKFTATGGFVARWTKGGTTEFDSLRYVGVDGTGDVYVGDTWGYRVWHLNGTGTLDTWNTPSQPPPDGGFNQMSGIGIDAGTGRLFAADTFENRVQAFQTQNPSGGTWRCLSAADCPAWLAAFGSREPGMPNSPGFNYPRALGVGGGSVFIDAGQALARYDVDGNFVARLGGWGSSPGKFIMGPTGIDVVASAPGVGNVYTVDLGNCRLMVMDFDGTFITSMGSCGTGANQMKAPWQIDVRGNLAYVTDRGLNRIVVWNLDTRVIVQTFSGSFAGMNLSGPQGVAVDPAGTWLYIADTQNLRVVRVSLDGTNTRQLVTTGTDSPEGSFRLPRYLAVAPDGRLYISDFNQRVYVFAVPA